MGSGATTRPQRETLIAAARRREIDCVLVWRLDRWGRSLVDLVNTLQELPALEVGFVSLSEALDLTTPSGRALAGIWPCLRSSSGYFAGSRESGHRPGSQGCEATWTALDRWQARGGNETAAAGGSQLSGNRQAPGGQPRFGTPVAADRPVNRAPGAPGAYNPVLKPVSQPQAVI